MGARKAYHVPQGDPCTRCGLSANSHRVSHQADGNPCKRCGLPESKHSAARPSAAKKARRSVRRATRPAYQCIGIDGEGQGRGDHRYVLLAASNASGTVKDYVEAADVRTGRLTTRQCLDFILSMGSKRHKLFSFSFNYDLTKILTDVDDASIYLLMRPELRPRKGKFAKLGPYPVRWQGYKLNLQGTKFTVQRGKVKVVVWDLFKFYQSKFTGALKDWKVGSKELLERMTKMKDARSEFDKLDPAEVRAYCFEECACMAELAQKLIDAHDRANIPLKTFYGAGSTGAAMLGVMGIKEKIRPVPEPMRVCVAQAFFGGRFENSILGMSNGPVFNYDISSAYPYQTTFLPCLEHGRWEGTERRSDLEGARAALVHYGLGDMNDSYGWAPFPYRTSDGTITFPTTSPGGWVWLDEYLAGERAFKHVHFREAWIYHSDCDCRPFGQIPEYYAYRLRIGKEGPGIVVKLAVNSCYGKLAQSVGNALFNNWIWAGMITSGCRAQILDVLAMHKDRENLLMVATDGIYTRERLSMPIPRETGTALVVADDGSEHRKPLGGWEEKEVPQGVFVARPGIYFPLSPTDKELKDVRGRGVGKKIVLDNWQRIIDAYEAGESVVKVANVSRFCGAKTSINRSGKPGHYRYRRACATDDILPSYGQWVERKVDMSFDPMPKRAGVGDASRLLLRSFPHHGPESRPYDRAMLSRESAEMLAAAAELYEQPDIDLSEYGFTSDDFVEGVLT